MLALGAEGELPPEGLGLVRSLFEMRASIGADAARLAARRADDAARAEIEARAAALAAADDPAARTAIYDVLWDRIIDAAGNLAYRLALNTLVAGQRVLSFDAATVGAEIADAPGGRSRWPARSPAATTTRAHAAARELLVRSIPESRPSWPRSCTTPSPTSSCCSSSSSCPSGTSSPTAWSAMTSTTRGRRSRWGSATSSSTWLEVRGPRALRGALRAGAVAPADRRVVGLGRAVLRRRLLLLLVSSRLAREPRRSGPARRPPLQPALQLEHRAAPDVGADDLRAVLVVDAAGRLRAVDGPARPGVVADLPVRDPHRAHRAPAAADRGRGQHAVTPPRPPRLQRAVPGQELRRHPHHLGPPLRDLRARARARPLRVDHQHRDPQPSPRRVPRVHRAVGRRPRGADLAGAGGHAWHGPGWAPAEEPEVEPHRRAGTARSTS